MLLTITVKSVKIQCPNEDSTIVVLIDDEFNISHIDKNFDKWFKIMCKGSCHDWATKNNIRSLYIFFKYDFRSSEYDNANWKLQYNINN